jgi:glyoxylate/hydroxypyruvate reductase
VFAQEPLPPESPMWAHAKVTITPHNAGDISPAIQVGEAVAQFDRFERGEPLLNLVDRARGY